MVTSSLAGMIIYGYITSSKLATKTGQRLIPSSDINKMSSSSDEEQEAVKKNVNQVTAAITSDEEIAAAKKAKKKTKKRSQDAFNSIDATKEKKRLKKDKKKRSHDARDASISIDDKKEKKRLKKDKKRLKKERECETKDEKVAIIETRKRDRHDPLIVQSSALEFADGSTQTATDITLLLFYQYVEPPWDSEKYKTVLTYMQQLGDDLQLGGRMRVAKEGLNCTLTGTHDHILEYCQALRVFGNGEFLSTEFKLTTDLPAAQAFPSVKIMPVTELVNYGLSGDRAPPIQYTGTHLDPQEYHNKMQESDTVMIDVRNHYEAAIGHFVPPGAKWVDPKMRKSTEFPIWLDKPETRETLKGKQVLMYCTGGVRCERASALLKYKMDHDPDIKKLGITGVYQLQGGIDKYFKEFPDGGYWEGKNFTFDKRFSHAPAMLEGTDITDAVVMGKCEACKKPWDKYKGKRRCPTCGVPSLICKDCMIADKSGIRKLDRTIRCHLCVEENITSKYQIRVRDQREEEEYEQKLQEKGLTVLRDKEMAPNPEGITRLAIKNMCRKQMDEASLMATLPGITHIVWKTDRTSQQFLGAGWVEMATSDDAAKAVAMDGTFVLGRPMYICYEAPGGKDRWPPPNSVVNCRKPN